jgi:hypothetical protein
VTALVLGSIALAAVVLSFALVALTLTRVIPGNWNVIQTPRGQELRDDQGNVSETISRVLGEMERLAALRDRGALTEAEFMAQKAKFLRVDPRADRPELPQRRP